jgi:CTP:molybdopterin cytidylyltransferase MocA
VLIKAELFADVLDLEGDVGARDLLKRSDVAEVECGHLASDHDVDTLEDLELIGGRLRLDTQGQSRNSSSSGPCPG